LAGNMIEVARVTFLLYIVAAASLAPRSCFSFHIVL
jgi:hypothetical protein